MERRRVLFWLVFLAAAGIVAVIPAWFDEEPEALVVQPAQRAMPARPVPVEGAAGMDAVTLAPGLLPGPRGESLRADLFAPHSWRVARPAPPVAPIARPAATPAPPPRPTAPPLPFEFFGKLEEGGRVLVFLQRGPDVHAVRVGDVIDGTYGVKSIGSTEMVLIYLPLDIRQTLSVGSKL